MELEEAINICKDKICNDVICVYCEEENNYCKSLCENSDCYLRQAIETVLKELENIDNYKATSYTSEYFRGVNECEDKWKKKIKDKINKLDLEIDEEYEKSMAYHQLVYARCELKELLEDK